MSDTTQDPPDEVEVFYRPFSDWLREQSGGKSHDELSEGLWDLVQRVRDTGKKGSIQFTVSVSTMKGDTDVLVISDEIKLRLPEHDRKASLFYTDKTGNLTRSDPQQLSFETLREVPGGAGVVDTKTGVIKEISQ